MWAVCVFHKAYDATQSPVVYFKLLRIYAANAAMQGDLLLFHKSCLSFVKKRLQAFLTQPHI